MKTQMKKAGKVKMLPNRLLAITALAESVTSTIVSRAYEFRKVSATSQIQKIKRGEK